MFLKNSGLIPLTLLILGASFSGFSSANELQGKKENCSIYMTHQIDEDGISTVIKPISLISSKEHKMCKSISMFMGGTKTELTKESISNVSKISLINKRYSGAVIKKLIEDKETVSSVSCNISLKFKKGNIESIDLSGDSIGIVESKFCKMAKEIIMKDKKLHTLSPSLSFEDVSIKINAPPSLFVLSDKDREIQNKEKLLYDIFTPERKEDYLNNKYKKIVIEQLKDVVEFKGNNCILSVGRDRSSDNYSVLIYSGNSSLCHEVKKILLNIKHFPEIKKEDVKRRKIFVEIPRD